MEMTFTLREHDFLSHLLFNASQSDKIRKKKITRWIFTTLVALAFTAWFYQMENHTATLYFALLSVLTLALYPFYFKWLYKRHYKRYVNDTYANRINEEVHLRMDDEAIYTKDKIGEARIKLAEIAHTDETSGHFFIKLSSGQSLVVPKEKPEQTMQLRTALENRSIKIIDKANWKW